MYRIKVRCGGLSDKVGRSAPNSILGEFAHRPWHDNVICGWDGAALWLQAENDYDSDGRALLDEFSDAVVACVSAEGDIQFAIENVDAC